MSNKIEYTWMQDSFGVMSMHKNIPNMKAKDSLIGTIRAKYLEDETEYYYELAGSDKLVGPFENMYAAIKKLEEFYLSGL